MFIKRKLWASKPTSKAALVAIIISAALVVHAVVCRGFLQEHGVMGLLGFAAFAAGSIFEVLCTVCDVRADVLTGRQKKKRKASA